MQTAVHNHVGPVGHEGLVLLFCLLFYHLTADHQIAEQRQLQTGRCLEREGEHVGGLVLAAIGEVELVALRLIDDAYRHFGLLLEAEDGAVEPALQLGFGGQAVGAGAGQLQIQDHTHWALSLWDFLAASASACWASNAS